MARITKYIVAVVMVSLVGSALTLLPSVALASGLMSPQQAVNVGVNAAADQGFDQHVSVRDKSTGSLLASTPNADEPVASESLVKLFTTTFIIINGYGSYQNTPDDVLNGLQYMIEYSDDASESARFTYSDIPWNAARYGLSGNTNNGPAPWGGASITANDESLFLFRVLKDPAVGPWLSSVMAQVNPYGSDGFNQFFGFNALGGTHGSKQGWGSNNFNGGSNTISSIGYTDKYTGAILSTGGNGSYDTMGGADTTTAALIQASSTALPVSPSQTVKQTLQRVTISNGVLSVWGWTYDPSNPVASNTVSVTVDGKVTAPLRAGDVFTQVNTILHVPGNHGFTVRVAVGPGPHTASFVAHALTGSNSGPVRSRTLSATSTIPTTGVLDSVVGGAGVFVATGWSLDPQSSSSNGTKITINGKLRVLVLANQPRPDVDQALAVSGNHGFQVTVGVAKGVYDICAISTELKRYSVPKVIGCRRIAVS